MRKRPGRDQDNPPGADEDMEYPRLDHTGQNKKERPKQSDNEMRRQESPRTGLDHSGGTSGRGRRPPDWGIWGQVAARRPGRAHPGRNKEHGLPPDWIIRGQEAAERDGLDHPGWIKRHQPQHPGRDHLGTKGGQTPRTGTSGVEQAAGATAPTTQKSRDTWWADAPNSSIWGRTRRSGHNHRGRGKMVAAPGRNARGGSTRRGPHPPGWSVQGKGAGRGEGKRRPRPWWSSERDKAGSNAKDKAEEMQGGREVDEVEETQGSKDEDRAVVQQRNRPMNEAGGMQRSSREVKAGVQQRSGDQDEAAER